jgi:hypothetical protein
LFLAVLLMSAAGCARGGATSSDGAAGMGGDAAVQDAVVESGPPAADGGDAAADAADVGGVLGPACDEVPATHAATGVTSSFTIAPMLAGKPFVFGEPNALPAGATILPLNFRFYVSRVALLTAAGAAVPADLVDATGALERFGVHLAIAEDPGSLVLRVRAPAGSYSGLSFLLGLEDGCNDSPFGRKFPLNDESQMTWQHTGGYLFLRFEDQVTNADAGAGAPAIPPQIHMGGVLGLKGSAPTVKILGALSVGTGGALQRQVNLDVGALIAGAQMDVDPASLLRVIPEPGVHAGERLRQHVPDLALFTFAP